MSTEISESNSRRQTIHVSALILGFGFAALSWFISGTGPDIEKYLSWADVAREGDLFQMKSRVLSPLEVPFSQWSAGPGLVFALGTIPLGSFGVRLVGWLAMIAFWWTFLKLLARVSPHPIYIGLGAAAAFLGTHAGFYSSAYGSEALAYPFAALLALTVFDHRDNRTSTVLAAGVCAGLLILLRSQLVIYAIPATAATVLKILSDETRPPRTQQLIKILLVIIPTILALAQTVWTNRWMTGSLLHSPYNFGSGDFKSVDWMHPEFLAMLFHPWHGLLIYHPLYAIGFAALITRAIQTRSPWERTIHAGTAVLILGS